jgi:hypothetical protein
VVAGHLRALALVLVRAVASHLHAVALLLLIAAVGHHAVALMQHQSLQKPRHLALLPHLPALVLALPLPLPGLVLQLLALLLSQSLQMSQ